jgi:predicted nucleic acid-binding protein
VIVLDSSAAVDYFVGRVDGEWVQRRLLEDPDLHGPHLLDVEVAHALRSLVSRAELRSSDARRALDDLAELDVRRYPHTLLLDRVWQLRRHVTAFDATYVALAEALDATLVTTDQRLARTHGHRARIVVP